MNTIEFTKLVATGNDFILIDNARKKVESRVGSLSKLAKLVCARRHSIGADGLLVLEGSRRADVAMRIFNPDGSEPEMCGNGSRCLAYYVAHRGITGNNLSIETQAGVLKAVVRKDMVKVGMTDPEDLRLNIALHSGSETINLAFVNTGVPHAVHIVRSLGAVDVKKIGRQIRYHKIFAPAGTNVDFIKIHGARVISMRTYERGVEDETFACGTGAAASAIIASELKNVRSPVKVRTFGGEALTIYFKKKDSGYKDVFLEGAVKLVFDSTIKI
ncbi:MAG: diaminopimelate epimerase [Candidatus Omnitrophica bacterium]|nr:diaminopimelate epimerase [Candidatus Omnitrophota bacterium]MBU4488920.1 diaminopimelate epimerase [Candidatus Omnitrophota bacterium]MCG2705316.1 diaminopimelate epimerase [Candidatus Omnitrophota bacterium]